MSLEVDAYLQALLFSDDCRFISGAIHDKTIDVEGLAHTTYNVEKRQYRTKCQTDKKQ